MTDILAVFRSRAQATDCNARLRAFGIPSSLVNTPSELNIGCGLSVKIPQNFFGKGMKIVIGGRYSAFYGFFKWQNMYGKNLPKRF